MINQNGKEYFKKEFKYVYESENRSVVSDSLQPHGLCSPWNSPGQNTGAGSLSLLQGIFPNQGLNPCLLHCKQILYQLSHKEHSRTLEWVADPLSSTSSWPRYWTKVSCTAGRFFTNWAIREASTSPPNDCLYFLAICMLAMKMKVLVAQSCPTFQPHGL